MYKFSNSPILQFSTKSQYLPPRGHSQEQLQAHNFPWQERENMGVTKGLDPFSLFSYKWQEISIISFPWASSASLWFLGAKGGTRRENWVPSAQAWL